MSADQFYYKVSPKSNARVSAIASIDLPLVRTAGTSNWYPCNSNPTTGKPREIEIDGVQTSTGDPNPYHIWRWSDPNYPEYGFRTPEEQFSYRFGQDSSDGTQGGNSGNDVSFQTIYCEWNRNKFADFVIESLVGKALTQAIAYNYFGYPIANVNRRIDLASGDAAYSDIGWGFGRMPAFGGSATPFETIPEENLGNADIIGGYVTLDDTDGSVDSSLSLENPVELGNQLSDLLKGENDDLVSRFYLMLGASRSAPYATTTAFVGSDNFVKSYTTSHVFEIRDFPFPFGGVGYTITDLFNMAGGSPNGAKQNNDQGYQYRDYESGRARDTNYFLYVNSEVQGTEGGEEALVAHEIPENANRKYDNPFQPLTPTHAKLWFPSMKTAVTNSPLGVTMGGSSGFASSKWYRNHVNIADLSDNTAAENQKLLFDANFKTSNLVSMFKLVPTGIDPDKKQQYLDNPHYTLNSILPKVLEYVAKVVPQNPRFAGPKPATKEPGSKTFRNDAETGMLFLEAPGWGHPNGGCNDLQTERIISGSFFEFQAGRKWSNAPYLSRDPRPDIPQPGGDGELISNISYEKLGAQEKTPQDTAFAYGANHFGIPPQENIDFATKFGLWNNDWIGGQSEKSWQLDGSYWDKNTQAVSNLLNAAGAGSALGAKENKQYQNTRGGFMLLPRNPRTIHSMIMSLPSIGDGRETIAKAVEAGAKPAELTKILSDIWLTYHYATKPNGMGWDGGFHSYMKDFFPDWNKQQEFRFLINTDFDNKIKDLEALTFNGVDMMEGGLSDTGFEVSHFNDALPLVYTSDLGNNGYGIEHTYGGYQRNFAGFPKFSIVEYYYNDGEDFKDTFDKYVPWFNEDKSKQGMGSQWGGDAMGQKQGLEAAITLSLYESDDHPAAGAAENFDFVDVPVWVNRWSLLEFPIWNWKRGGGEGYGDLNEINWAPVIEDPTDADAPPYAAKAFDKWKKYIEKHPKLLEQSRDCVPAWVQSLRIYPTVKEDALQHGFVPSNMPFTTESFEFWSGTWKGHEHLKGQTGAGGTGDYVYGWSNNTDSVLPKGAKSHSGNLIVKYAQENGGAGYRQKQTVLGATGEGYAQDVNVYVLQQEYLSGTGGGEFGFRGYKSAEGNLPAACKPWMTLNFEREEDITSGDFRSALDTPRVTLTYAVELEIDEVQLVLDLVKMGVVGLAGESSEYVEMGLDLDQIFSSAFAQGGSNLYSESLAKAYKTYAATEEEKYVGMAIDFGAFPSFKNDTTFEAQKQAIEAAAKVNEKMEKAKLKYPKEAHPVTSYIWLKDLSKETAIYTKPASGSRILGSVNNFTTVKVLKEWVNGMGNWTKVEIRDPEANDMNEKIGFIAPEKLEPAVQDLFFSTGVEDGKGIYDKGNPILSLSHVQIREMSEMAQAVIPTWWKLDQPYYHLGDGEYWLNVTLKGEECVVDETDLDQKKEIAKKSGLRTLLDFYGKEYSDEDIEKISSAYLVAKVDDHHLDLRPGSEIQFLLKVGAIYLDSFPDREKSLETLRGESTYQLSVNQQFYAGHINQALFGLNRMYLEIFASQYRLKGIDLLNEMQRLEYVPIMLKKFLAANAVNVASKDDNIIDLGFDDKFKITFIAYRKHDEKDYRLLNVGFDHFTNKLPLNNTNTMSLFYYHREIRSPMLKWQDAVKKYFIDPQPQIVKVDPNDPPPYPSAGCSPPRWVLPSWEDILGPIAANMDKMLQLDPRFDLGSFQFSLWQYLPPCPKPPSGIGETVFQGAFDVNNERFMFEDLDALTAFGNAFDGENIKEYVGDWMASSGALEDIQDKILDLDDLYDYVLNYIDPPTLYSKICKCFLDLIGLDTITLPNLEIDANAGSMAAKGAISPSDSGKSANELFDVKGPSLGTTLPGKDKGKEFEAADLICSFCLEIPSFFLRLPTTDILQELLNALLALLEYILTQLLLELIKVLLDMLLQCPEITCPEGEKNVKDFGGQNLGNIFNEAPIPVEDYFSECGVIFGGDTGVTGDMIIEVMENISNRLSSGEVLGLIGGSITESMLTVAEQEIAKSPPISAQLNNRAKIEDFFSCAGLGLPPNILADIEDDIVDKYENPELCNNLLLDAKNKLAERCGVSDLFDAAAKRATSFDLDKYKALADAIRKHQNMSQELPPIFGDCKGNMGVLSGLPNPTMDHVIDRTVEQIVSPIRTSMTEDLKRLTKPRNYPNGLTEPAIMVSRNFTTEYMKDVAGPVALIKLLSDSQYAYYRDELYPFVYDLNDASKGNTETPVNVSLFGLQNKISTVAATSENNASVKISLDSTTQMEIEFKPAVYNEEGEVVYEDNYETRIKLKNAFGVGDNAETINLSSPNKNLPDLLVDHLSQYPLDPDSNLAPQSQYFSQLMLSNLEKSGYEMSATDYDTLKEITANKVFWTVWKSVLDTMAGAVGSAELLGEYKIDRAEEFLNGVNPLFIMPGIGVMFAFLELAAQPDGITDDLVESFYEGTYYRKEITRLDMRPVGEEGGLIDIKSIKDIIKKHYDFSIHHDPNADKLGMPHYAVLNGLLKALVQVFVGEIYIRGLIPISKFPTDVITKQESTVELVYRNMMDWIKQGPPGMEGKMVDIIYNLFTGCSNADFQFIPDDKDDENAGIPGTAKGTTQGFEKDYRIQTWKDGLRFIIREELMSPIPYLQNKLSSFTKKNGTGIAKINPVAAVSYPFLMQVHDEPFRKEGLDNVSLAQPSRVNAFKDGRFFFQYYFEIIDWEEGDENYVEAVVDRDLSLKGIVSEENFIQLISDLCGIPPLYPENTPPVEPLLGTGADGSLDEGNSNISLRDMFKEINFGVRYCYGAVQSNAVDEDGELIIQDQSPEVAEMINTIKAMANIDDNTIVQSQKLDVGPHNTSSVNEFLDYVKKTKSLLLIEDANVKATDVPGQLTKPYYTVVLPLFDQKRKINGNDGYKGGWSFLEQRAHSANYVSDQIGIFLNETYGAGLLKELFKEMTLNPAYEGLLRYCFPVPKMANMMVILNVLIASKHPPFLNAFNNTKRRIRALISQTTNLKGRDQYKNNFSDPY